MAEEPRRDLLVHDILDQAAGQFPFHSAVRDANGSWNYRTLEQYSHAVAAWLTAEGVAAGDRVLVQAGTDRRLVAMFHGVSRCGAVFVPINPQMKDFHVRSVIESAEPRLVLTEQGLTAAWPRIEELHGAGARAGRTPADREDVAVLVYTSGSTAAPKGVIGPHGRVTFAAAAIQAVLGYRSDDVVFCRFPMSWDYGLYKVLLTALAGAEIVLAGGESDLVLLDRMHEVGATVVPIVPSLATMIAALAARDPARTAPVRMFTNTGAALSPATMDSLRAAFPGAVVVRQFGQTECKRVSIMPPAEEHERPESVGRPLPGTRVQILGPDGAELAPGETGEIVVSGPHVMPGYWRDPELTSRTFRPDPATGEPRLHTGDYGRFDGDGYLYFEGRRDDMFKRKGIRMSTLEIEAAAMDIPGVRAAAAVPPAGGRDLILYAETTLDPHHVLRELARRLEAAKVPARCHVVDTLPLTTHGKNAVRELAALADGAGR